MYLKYWGILTGVFYDFHQTVLSNVRLYIDIRIHTLGFGEVLTIPRRKKNPVTKHPYSHPET
jgi:hypothetical protein